MGFARWADARRLRRWPLFIPLHIPSWKYRSEPAVGTERWRKPRDTECATALNRQRRRAGTSVNVYRERGRSRRGCWRWTAHYFIWLSDHRKWSRCYRKTPLFSVGVRVVAETYLWPTETRCGTCPVTDSHCTLRQPYSCYNNYTACPHWSDLPESEVESLKCAPLAHNRQISRDNRGVADRLLCRLLQKSCSTDLAMSVISQSGTSHCFYWLTMVFFAERFCWRSIAKHNSRAVVITWLAGGLYQCALFSVVYHAVRSGFVDIAEQVIFNR